MKEHEDWTKSTKCVTIAYFYKKHDKINENGNNSNNRYDVFKYMEFESAKYEEDSAKTTIEEEKNNMEKELQK